MAAAISKHLPRSLAGRAQSALGSMPHLERTIASFSGAILSTACGEDVLHRGKVELTEECASDGDIRFFGPIKSSVGVAAKFMELRSDSSCCFSLPERGLALFQSASSKYPIGAGGIYPDENSRRFVRRPPPQTYSIRTMSTAVSSDDKIGAEVEDEELDLLEIIEDGKSKGTDAKKKKKNRDVEEGDEVAEAEEEITEFSIYTSAEGPSHFTSADVNKFFRLSPEDQQRYFGEGLPSGLVKEFEDTKESSILVRARFLHLFKRFEKHLAETRRPKKLDNQAKAVSTSASKPPQCLFEGLVKSGKSVALAMLVHWARTQGWLVFYVPHGREWTSTGMFFKNPQSGLWDTPIQAKVALQGFLKSHGTLLGDIPCRVMTPLQLGEIGMPKIRGPQEISLHEGATLRDLVEKGVALSQAAVSCLVRLREELNLVHEVPVLIAIDEFNSWFTFSAYSESTGARSRRPVHARELSMVKAFRTMEGPLMMAAAFSHSMAVGRLPVHLPGVPKGVRYDIPRYDLEEATTIMKYYFSKKVTESGSAPHDDELTEHDIKKLFYLTNGNGVELRTLTKLV